MSSSLRSGSVSSNSRHHSGFAREIAQAAGLADRAPLPLAQVGPHFFHGIPTSRASFNRFCSVTSMIFLLCHGSSPPRLFMKVSLLLHIQVIEILGVFSDVDLSPIHLAACQPYDLAARGNSRFMAAYPIKKTVKDTLSKNRRSFSRPIVSSI